jgi:integrase
MAYSGDTNKAYEDSISIEQRGNKYRLNFSRKCSRQYFGVNQKRLSTGLSLNKHNCSMVEKTALEIHLDIISGNFAPDALDKYGLLFNTTKLTVVEQIKPKEYSILELWNRWIDYKSPSWQAKTKLQYETFTRHLDKIPLELRTLDKAIDLRHFLVSNLSPDTVKRLLIRLNAAVDFAFKSNLIFDNPFIGMSKEIKIQPKSEDDEVDPFTAEERDLIIAAYENHRLYKRYVPFLKFLFWTGCRPSEAVGLHWNSVSDDLSVITFREAIVYCGGKKIAKNSTKTNKSRKFPVTPKIKELLLELKTQNTQSNDFVFQRKDGSAIDYAHFLRSWKGGNNGVKKYQGMVTKMVEKGIFSHYRNPYQTRHTFATLAVENGMFIHDVARVIGNTPKVCEERYVKGRRNIFIPDF